MSAKKRLEWQKLYDEVLARSPGTGGLMLETLRECSGLELFHSQERKVCALPEAVRARARKLPASHALPLPV